MHISTGSNNINKDSLGINFETDSGALKQSLDWAQIGSEPA